MTFLTSSMFHLGIEGIGSAVTLVAQNHICRKPWHKVAIWAAFAIPFSMLSVLLVG